MSNASNPAHRLWQRIPPPLRFILLFLVSLGALSVIYPWLSTRYAAQMESFMAMTAWIVGKGLTLLGADVMISRRMIHASGISVEVIEGVLSAKNSRTKASKGIEPGSNRHPS